MSAALRHRDFALLWSGQGVSLVGDGIFTVALALETLRIDSRPTALSFVLAARLLPTVLLLLVGGVVVDRVPRRLTMLASDATRGIAVGAIAVLVGAGQIQLWELIAMSVVFGTADAFFYPASTAVVPELLPAELLVQGSALTATSRTVAQVLVGPALGGVLVASLGTVWAFALDGASFFVSAACLLAMASRPRSPASHRSLLGEVGEGLRYCRSQRWLWMTILAAGVANFAAFSPLGVLVPLLVRNVLNQGALAFGLVLAAGGLGGAIASLTVARFGAPRRRITSMWLAWSLAGASLLGLALAPSVWIAGVFLMVVYGLLEYGNVLWNPLMQELVPPTLIGRASSVDWLVSISLSPLGVLVAGLVAGSIGTRTTMLLGGGIATLAAAVLFVPGVRDPERLGSSRLR
jgi:MFS family permease